MLLDVEISGNFTALLLVVTTNVLVLLHTVLIVVRLKPTSHMLGFQWLVIMQNMFPERPNFTLTTMRTRLGTAFSSKQTKFQLFASVWLDNETFFPSVVFSQIDPSQKVKKLSTLLYFTASAMTWRSCSLFLPTILK